MKLNSESRAAVTEAERGCASIIANSPTSAPGPRIARMRSLPEGDIDADLEQALLDPIAAVARIARGEQGLVGLEAMRPRGREQRRRKFRRQHGQEIFGSRTAASP